MSLHRELIRHILGMTVCCWEKTREICVSSQGILQDDLRQIEQNVKHVFAFFKKKKKWSLYLFVCARMHLYTCTHSPTFIHGIEYVWKKTQETGKGGFLQESCGVFITYILYIFD